MSDRQIVITVVVAVVALLFVIQIAQRRDHVLNPVGLSDPVVSPYTLTMVVGAGARRYGGWLHNPENAQDALCIREGGNSVEVCIAAGAYYNLMPSLDPVWATAEHPVEIGGISYR